VMQLLVIYIFNHDLLAFGRELNSCLIYPIEAIILVPNKQ